MGKDEAPRRDAAEQTCGQCAAVTAAEAGESIVDDRLAWFVTISCPACGNIETHCGWDLTPAPWRELLIYDAGMTTIRADLEAGRPFRTRLISVFRKSGATIAESVKSYQTLTGAGLTGTPTEMELLAARLTRAGAFITRSPTDREA